MGGIAITAMGNKNISPYYIEERRTLFVIVLTFIVMLAEVLIGYFSKSMALVADGIHMGSHVMLIGLNLFAYYFVRKQKERNNHTYDADRIMQLSAFTSGLLLLLMAVFICSEGFEHMEAHHHIENFPLALSIAVVGLVVNSISARVLHSDHFENNPNNHAAYLHVMSDVLVKIGVIIGLICSYIWDITWLDAIVAMITGVIVLMWAIGLLKRMAKSLTKNLGV